MIDNPRGRSQLQTVAAVPPARQSSRIRVVQLLADNRELSPSEIARAVGRSVQRVSTVLAALSLAEVVRYDTDGKRNRYRLKHPSEVRNVLASLSRFVQVASVVNREQQNAAVPIHVSGIPEIWQSATDAREPLRDCWICW